MSPTDLRVRRTRKLLRDALIHLIEERGFNALKVSDIADQAMINRATFYRHFRDKHDLLMHCMDDVFEDLHTQARPPRDDAGEIDHRAADVNVEAMLVHVRDNANFYRVMLGKDGAGAFVSRLRTFLTQISAARWQIIADHIEEPPMPPEMIFNFTASAYVGAISWWVENDCPGTPADMAQHLVYLTIHGAYRSLGLQPPE